MSTPDGKGRKPLSGRKGPPPKGLFSKQSLGKGRTSF